MSSAPVYPVNLVLEGRRVLVVGGGKVAAQKIGGLLESGAVVHVVAVEVHPVVRRIEGISYDERPFRPDDLEGVRLAVAATDDPAVNRQVLDEGEARNVWVNSADDPANCSFLLPARVRRGDLLVAFSTGGRAPGVSRWLRRRYDEEFGPEHATLIELVAAERDRIHAEGRSTEGLDWQGALDSGTLDLVREGRLAEAKERLQACLSSSSD